MSLKLKNKIPPNLIESLSYASDNPAFKTADFRNAMIDYRQYGLSIKNEASDDTDTLIRLIKAKCGFRGDAHHP